MAKENTRMALAVMSTDDEAHRCHSAILNLNPIALDRMKQVCSLITKVHDKDRTVREMRFLPDPYIEPYGHDVSDWIDSMGGWGMKWHSALVSNHHVIMPLNCIFMMPCLPLVGTSTELVVTYRPDQLPQISWRFAAHDRPVEFFTYPLPVSTYRWYAKQLMPPVTPEYEYEHSH